MEIYSIRWSFALQPMLNVLQITGYCDDISLESLMFGQIVSWLEKAKTCFRAQYISEKPNLISISNIAVSCKLFFKCKEDANDFLGYIKYTYDL